MSIEAIAAGGVATAEVVFASAPSNDSLSLKVVGSDTSVASATLTQVAGLRYTITATIPGGASLGTRYVITGTVDVNSVTEPLTVGVWEVRTLLNLDAHDVAQNMQHAATQAAVAAVPTVEEIDTQLSDTHGAGSWGGSGSLAGSYRFTTDRGQKEVDIEDIS